jgi:hypothetical protein
MRVVYESTVLYCHSGFESCVDFRSTTQWFHKIETNNAEMFIYNFSKVSLAPVKGKNIQLHMNLEEKPYPLPINSFASFQL